MLAAEYVRMSTEHQKYSIASQRAAISGYALANGFQIVRTYADEARSGLDLRHRPGLKKLLEDVLTEPEFKVVLVYDVSRWGRFQDVDEGAYYEFLCKRSGVRIHYCVEPFPNDETLASVLVKTVKRAMAGEFIRELSAKVFAAQSRTVKSGYKAGGRPGYGLRRLLVDCHGKPKGILVEGEWKSIASDRVTFVRGPENEVKVVQEIFDRFVNDRWGASRIAAELNRRGTPRSDGSPWDYFSVYDILRHPKYAGSMVFNRKSGKLRSASHHNPRDQWIIQPGSFEALVPPDLFESAQERFSERLRNEDLLEDLRHVIALGRKITWKTFSTEPRLRSASTYNRRFGRLTELLQSLGYCRQRYKKIDPDSLRRSRFRKLKLQTFCALLKEFHAAGIEVSPYPRGVTIFPDRRFEVQIAIHLLPSSRGARWDLLTARSSPEFFLALVMDPANARVEHYALFHQVLKRPYRYVMYESELENQAKWLSTISEVVSELGTKISASARDCH